MQWQVTAQWLKVRHQLEGMPDVLPMDPSLVHPASLVETTPIDVTTVFRKKTRQAQTSPIERPHPNRAESGAARQEDRADLSDHESQEMTKMGPLIVDLHTASLGNIIALISVISGSTPNGDD